MIAVRSPLPENPALTPGGAERCADGRGTWSSLFFSTHAREIDHAKALCASCDVRVECLAGAVERGEPDGVWGGMLFHRGVPVAFRPTRGRPPVRRG